MKTVPLTVKVVLDNNEPDRMKLVFLDVVSRRNFTIVNSLNRAEFEVVEKFCAPVVWSIISRWVDPSAGIAGIQNIELKRHTITIVKADQFVFKWETILEQIYVAIRQAYPGRWVTMQVNQDESVNALVDWVIEFQYLKQTLDLSVDADSPIAWTARA